MAGIVPGLPEASEYGPYFERYVEKARYAADPVTALEQQLTEINALFADIPESKYGFRYAEGKWTIKELIGHLSDTERIFAYRALRIARNDNTPLPGFDQDPYIVAARANDVAWEDLVNEFQLLRQSNIQMLRNLPPESWTCTGTASGNPMSTRAMTYIMIGHVNHHAAILRERYL